MPEEKQSKNQRREAAREAAREAREKQKKRETRNRIFLIGGSTLAVLAVVAVIALVITNSARPAGPGPANMASDGIVLIGSESGIEAVTTPALDADADPEPTDTSTLDRDINIVTYVDYLCPYCQLFEDTNAEQIRQLVESGIASLEIHPVMILDNYSAGTHYSARAANMMACIANDQPDVYLDVQDALFANQPEEQTTGLGDSELIDLAEGAGVSYSGFESCVRDGTYRAWATAANDRATSDPDLANPSTGSFGTPTVLVNGQRYSGALDDASAFSSFVQSAYASTTGGTSTSTPAPTETPAG